MKNVKFLALASGLLGLMLSQATAQTTIDIGTKALLAGWSFDGLSGVPAQFGPWRPAYSDVWGNVTANPYVPNAGAIYADGTNGSGSDTLRAATGFNVGNTPDETGGSIGLASGSRRGLFTTGLADSFSILVHTQDAVNFFGDITVSFYANADSTATIDWSYGYYDDTDAFQTIDTDITTNISGSSYASYSEPSFAGISGLDGVEDLYIIGTITAPSGEGVRLDNIAIYGVAAAIPEPSASAIIMGAIACGLIARRRNVRRALRN